MTLVIKSRVTTLDTGSSKHQCVTMQTKYFKERLFSKSFLCFEAVVKKFTFQNQAHIRLRIRFYLKILTNNRMCSKCGYSDPQFFFKYVQKESKSFFEFNVSKLLVFTSQKPDLQFWFFHIFAFSILRFVYFTFKTHHF